MALRSTPTFLLNVTMNRDKQITGVFAGDMIAAHAPGARSSRAGHGARATRCYDIVVTTNAGYPLDQNLYQAVKGDERGRPHRAPGGAILMAAACEDGLPDHGRYGALLAPSGLAPGVWRCSPARVQRAGPVAGAGPGR